MSKHTAVVAATGLATVLAAALGGCAQLVPGSSPTGSLPTQALSTPATTPTASVTPSVTLTPSGAPSTVAAGKAAGRLSFHKANLVSKTLVGTCSVVAGKPTVTLADRKNDFYGTVDLVIVLATDAGDVVSIVGKFGEDEEKLVTRTMVHPEKGTSAQLSVSGAEYRISGNAMLYEGDAKTGSLIPYSIVATCARSDWLG